MTARTIPPEVTDDIRALITDAGIDADKQDLVARILATGVGLGMDDTSRLDLKITSAALTEMLRVTKPGGRLVVCEFSTPPWKPFNLAYGIYLRQVLPRVARLVSSNTPAYGYLAESIADWPDQRDLARVIEGAGWERVGFHNLTGGIVALHRAFAPR